MKRWQTSLLVGAGLALLIALVWQSGIEQVAGALGDLGLVGLAWICVVQLAGTLLCAEALRRLTPGASFLAAAVSRLLRDGVSNIAGIVPGLGEVAGARVLTEHGTLAAVAAAATAADVATEVIAQALYTSIGLVFLVPYIDQSVVTRWLGGGLLAIAPLVVVFVVMRRRITLDRVESSIASGARALRLDRIPGLAHFGQEAARLARGRENLGAAIGLHLVAWALGAVQVWIAAAAMGVPLGPGGALALESLVYAARGALFLVPWSIGVQEVSFVLLGALLGLDKATCLALSIALRARDLLIGLPVILSWSAREGWCAYRHR